MKIEGTFQGMDPVISGVSQAGNPWQKTYFEIITLEGERSRRVAFGAFGNVVEQVKALPKGVHVEVKFTAESRDYVDRNGQKRYSTDLSCYGLAMITKQSVQPQRAQPATQAVHSVLVTQPGQPAPATQAVHSPVVTQPGQPAPATRAVHSVVVTQPGQPAPQQPQPAPSSANFPGVNSASAQPLPEGTTMNVQGACGAAQYNQEFPY